MKFLQRLNHPRAALAIFSLALVPAAYWYWQARHLEHLGYFHDDGMYLVGAKTLAEEGAYRIPSLPESPAQTKYPPLFPLLLSLVWRWGPGFPQNLPWLLLAAWLMLPLNAWLMVRLLESWGCSRWRAVCAAAWINLNPYIVFFSINLMAELMVSVLITGCLLAAQRARTAKDAATAGVLAAAAYLTKTAALPLLVAAPAWFAWKRRWRMAAAMAAPCLAAVAAWNIWSATHRAPVRDAVEAYYFSYLSDFFQDLRVSDLPLVVWQNLATILAAAGNLLVPDPMDFPVLGQNFSRVVGVFAIVGVVRQARRSGVGIVHWFALGYAILTIVWVYPPNERFLIPLAPVIAFGAQAELIHLAGLFRAAWRSGRRDQRVAVSVFGAATLGVAGWAAAMMVSGHLAQLSASLQRSRRQAESNGQAYAWVRANVPEGVLVMARRDATMYLYTGRPAIRPLNFPKLFYRQDRQGVQRGIEALPEFARKHGVQYWLTSDIDLDDDPFVRQSVDFDKLTAKPPYRLVFQAPMTRIFRID